MPLHVDAVYENGVLKPLQELDLAEHEQVVLTIDRTAVPYEPDTAYVDRLRKSLEIAPGLAEVRRRLSKIPGSLTSDFIASTR